MKTAAQAERKAMKLSECAAILGVSVGQVKKWIDAGHLQAFVPPGVEVVSKNRGPKNLRVWPEDWERFLKAQTKTVKPAAIAVEAKTPPALQLAGLDGKRRGKSGGAARR